MYHFWHRPTLLSFAHRRTDSRVPQYYFVLFWANQPDFTVPGCPLSVVFSYSAPDTREIAYSTKSPQVFPSLPFSVNTKRYTARHFGTSIFYLVFRSLQTCYSGLWNDKYEKSLWSVISDFSTPHVNFYSNPNNGDQSGFHEWWIPGSREEEPNHHRGLKNSPENDPIPSKALINRWSWEGGG